MTLCEAENPFGASWGADGNILFGGGAAGIFRVSASGGEPELLVELSAAEVRSFLEPGGRWQISTEGGAEPRWNPAGKELFYRRGDEMWAVSVTTEPSFQLGRPTLLLESSFEPGLTFHNYDVSPDGERFLMVESDEAPEAAGRVNVVLHWLDELERRVQ